MRLKIDGTKGPVFLRPWEIKGCYEYDVISKLCRFTELDSESPTMQKIAKTKPQVDSLPFFKK